MAEAKLEKLINEIMAECEADGEPVTREEAEEMARMEINSKSERHYEQSDKKRKQAKKERKVDETKKSMLAEFKKTVEEIGGESIRTKTETEIAFVYGGDDYTLKLTRHRKPKT